MKLIDLLNLYNFRSSTTNDRFNTSIVRIYPYKNLLEDYFEFGVYDFGDLNILRFIINKDILNSDVDYFTTNKDGNVEIYLENNFSK